MPTFDRLFAMPDAHTFKMKPVKEILDWYCKQPAIVIDPFARDSKYAGEVNHNSRKTIKRGECLFNCGCNQFVESKLSREELEQILNERLKHA